MDATTHDLDRRCRAINYRICTAIDMLKLGMVIDEMRAAGVHDAELEAMNRMASGLLAMMRSANHRAHGEEPVGPI